MHPETQTEWEIRMFGKIISYLRDELCIDFPYLERALSALSPEGKEDINAFATEGIHLYFPPAHYLRVFEENELFLRRAYLHTVLHCLYAHPWQCGSREEKRWNTACDIAIEYIIDGFNKQTTRRLLSWLRQQFYRKGMLFPRRASMSFCRMSRRSVFCGSRRNFMWTITVFGAKRTEACRLQALKTHLRIHRKSGRRSHDRRSFARRRATKSRSRPWLPCRNR